MEEKQAKMMAEWLDNTSQKILEDMGVSYKHHTRYISDTDANLSYHGLLVETIFYKLFMSILEAVSDDQKDEQMQEMFITMKRYRSKVRNEEEMLKLILEQRAQ